MEILKKYPNTDIVLMDDEPNTVGWDRFEYYFKQLL